MAYKRRTAVLETGFGENINYYDDLRKNKGESLTMELSTRLANNFLNKLKII